MILFIIRDIHNLEEHEVNEEKKVFTFWMKENKYDEQDDVSFLLYSLLWFDIIIGNDRLNEFYGDEDSDDIR